MNLQIPKSVWIEMFDERDACDVIIEMESGMIYTAMFVTFNYLRRQMDLGHSISKQLPDTPPVRYVAIETPHVLIEKLEREVIEDTIDNLLALDVFEGFFTQVTDDDSEPQYPNGSGKRATTEVAAVVISDVLSIEGD